VNIRTRQQLIDGNRKKLRQVSEGIDVGIPLPALPLGHSGAADKELFCQLFLSHFLLLSEQLEFFVEFQRLTSYFSQCLTAIHGL
jgi:hypothetical protein